VTMMNLRGAGDAVSMPNRQKGEDLRFTSPSHADKEEDT
jgi:hypothetical protein